MGMLRMICALWMATMMATAGAAGTDYVPQDYVWRTQGRNSSESMPCGGGDVGLNVWVEGGAVMFYAQRSGWFDENNTMLKAGRWRISFDGNALEEGFEQRLSLADGAVTISGGGARLRLWADVEQPVIYCEMETDRRTEIRLSYESWRHRERPVSKAECQQCSYKWKLPADCTTHADSIRAEDGRLTFEHRNRATTVFDYTVEREHLEAVKDRLPNPTGGLLMRGAMDARGFKLKGMREGTYATTDYRAWDYTRRARRALVVIRLDDGEAIDARASKQRSAGWWHDYWQRSWIETDAGGAAARMVRNYELFRYMLGCNARGVWPTKFNGGLFTFDPCYADSAYAPTAGEGRYTPDYRKWGGGTMTAQNQRLVYWPMLKSGDAHMMRAQLDTYVRLWPAARLWARHFWGHGGACFSEQLENSGLPNPAEYGKHKAGEDLGVEHNKWLEYEWDTVLEFCRMMTLVGEYGGDNYERYRPFVEDCLRFFYEHYPADSAGRLLLYPGSGCETYKMARNASSTVAALTALLPYTPAELTAGKRLPDVARTVIDGDTVIAPAEAWERIQNVETPQLYPVFPWRLFGLGRPGLATAVNTYEKDPHAVNMRSAAGWKQDNIWAACLGLTDEAARLNTEKLADGPYRFPAFWPPGFDWAPDHNRGGAGMIGLQEMLLQEAPNGELILFAAWPRQWNVRFRLHATGGRTVEAEMKNGLITVKE